MNNCYLPKFLCQVSPLYQPRKKLRSVYGSISAMESEGCILLRMGLIETKLSIVCH